MPPRILLVDDEVPALRALKRYLRDAFVVETAPGGAEGLEVLGRCPDVAVVVSDQRMPGMDGIAFLEQVRHVAPHAIRIILTAYADLDVAVQAVNRGQIFRFLSKPCDPEALLGVLETAVRQYHLEQAERELVHETLMGSIRLLTELLGAANPLAYGRTMRTLPIAKQLAAALRADDPWMIEMAAMLSQVGCAAVPADVVARGYSGQPMPREEGALFESHPGLAHQLLRNLPRLETVARIVGYQDRQYDGGNRGRDEVFGEATPLGARILKVALDFDTLVQSGRNPQEAFEEMCGRRGWYDPRVVAALGGLPLVRLTGEELGTEVAILDLTIGMVLAEPLVTPQGAILAVKGQAVTETTLLGLRRMIEAGIAMRRPVRVVSSGERRQAPEGQ